jgi:putative RNA 2'-phosphotransferase
MDDRRQKRISKLLSYHLRHRPDALGIELEPGGWIHINTFLEAANSRGKKLSLDDIQHVVASCPKQRFTLDAAGGRIRANQGHSVAVDLELTPTTPPSVLYHGTYHSAVASIQSDGLRKMARHHVHLSTDLETAQAVGSRRGKAVIFGVDTAAMVARGYEFFVSDNGVWLTDEVPPEFLLLD